MWLHNLPPVSRTGSRGRKADKLNFGYEDIDSSSSAASSAEPGSAPEGLRSRERGHRLPAAQGHLACLGLVHLRSSAPSFTYLGFFF